MRYLIDFDVRANLVAGRDIEQLLAEGHAMGQRVVRYLSIERKAPGAWTVRLCEMFDNGGPDFFDVDEFEAVDPDLPFGKEWMFEAVEDALQFAAEQLGARADHYVNQGMVQAEYEDRYYPSMTTASSEGSG